MKLWWNPILGEGIWIDYRSASFVHKVWLLGKLPSEDTGTPPLACGEVIPQGTGIWGDGRGEEEKEGTHSPPKVCLWCFGI